MRKKLNPLSRPQKDVINTLAVHIVSHGLAEHLKKGGCPNTEQIVSNVLDSFTPKQNQIIRALQQEIKTIKAALAKAFEKDQ